jgi:site-specific DNA-methyltransferase (adenine-specific)
MDSVITDKYSLYHGDCLEVMKQIPENSIDMVLCDLPYQMTACKWDVLIPFDKLWESYKRVCKKDAAIVLFGSMPFSAMLVYSNLKAYKHDWIWQKNAGSNFARVKYQPMREHEQIMVFCYGKPIYNPIMQERSESGKARNKYPYKSERSGRREFLLGTLSKRNIQRCQELRYPSSIQKFNRERGLHPTQKPVALCEYLIKTYSNENDIILDNCMGSGSTGIACLNTNRKFVGIELDDNYFNIAKQRIETHITQKSLF